MRNERDNGRNGRNGQNGRNGREGRDGQGTDAGRRKALRSDAAAAWVNLVPVAVEERAANLGAILSAQAHFLTQRLLDRHAQDFEKDGGFSERLYKARTRQWRHGPEETDRTDRTDRTDKTD